MFSASCPCRAGSEITRNPASCQVPPQLDCFHLLYRQVHLRTGVLQTRYKAVVMRLDAPEFQNNFLRVGFTKQFIVAWRLRTLRGSCKSDARLHSICKQHCVAQVHAGPRRSDADARGWVRISKFQVLFDVGKCFLAAHTAQRPQSALTIRAKRTTFHCKVIMYIWII